MKKIRFFMLLFVAGTLLPATALAQSDLQAQIQALQEQLQQMIQQLNESRAASSGTAGEAQEQIQVAPADEDTYEYEYQEEELTPAQQVFQFKKDLSYKMSDDDTSSDIGVLQQFLTDQGVYTADITGYFGKTTRSAVRKLQKGYGLSQTGAFDQATRDFSNKIIREAAGVTEEEVAAPIKKYVPPSASDETCSSATGSCGSAKPKTSVLPEIQFYTSTPTIKKGESAYLNWNASGFNSGCEGSWELYKRFWQSGSVYVKPSVTTQYRILCWTSDDRYADKDLTITVIEPVTSTPVETQPIHILPVTPTQATTSVPASGNAATPPVSISTPVETQPIHILPVTPTQATTSVPAWGNVTTPPVSISIPAETQPIHILPVAPVGDIQFRPNVWDLQKGDGTYLNWDAPGYNNCIGNWDLYKSFPAKGQATVFPSATTRYTIVCATKSGETSSKEITIQVTKPPTATSVKPVSQLKVVDISVESAMMLPTTISNSSKVMINIRVKNVSGVSTNVTFGMENLSNGKDMGSYWNGWESFYSSTKKVWIKPQVSAVGTTFLKAGASILFTLIYDEPAWADCSNNGNVRLKISASSRDDGVEDSNMANNEKIITATFSGCGQSSLGGAAKNKASMVDAISQQVIDLSSKIQAFRWSANKK